MNNSKLNWHIYIIYNGNELPSMFKDGFFNLIIIDSKILSSSSLLDDVRILKLFLSTAMLHTDSQCSLIAELRGLTRGTAVRELTALCWSMRKERFFMLDPIYSKLHFGTRKLVNNRRTQTTLQRNYYFILKLLHISKC